MKNQRRLTKEQTDATLITLEKLCDMNGIMIEDSSDYYCLVELLTDIDFGETSFDNEHHKIKHLLECVVIFVANAIQ